MLLPRVSFGGNFTMHGKTHFFTVRSHRSANSLFGAASNPVMRNGAVLCFESEERARAECNRLNSARSSSQVHYSIKSAHDLPVDTGLAALADGFRRLAGQMSARR